MFRDPEGCDPSACNTFIGIDTNEGNSDYLDIYMEGASEGWIAVGFTETPNMVHTHNLQPEILMSNPLLLSSQQTSWPVTLTLTPP